MSIDNNTLGAIVVIAIFTWLAVRAWADRPQGLPTDLEVAAEVRAVSAELRKLVAEMKAERESL